MAEELDMYTCHHGPGELVIGQKQIFVESIGSSIDQVHKSLLFRAPRQEIIAAEMVALEELLSSNEALRNMVDDSLMKVYFGRAASDLLRTKVEESRINARMGVYLAMYLKHGNHFFALTQQSPTEQKKHLMDFHTAIGQIQLDGGLAKFLNTQIPCKCLEEALPSLKQSS